jgi:hypothetical protein
MFMHPTAARGGASQAGIVNDHGNAVGRELNIELNSVRAVAQSQFKRSQRILRGFARRAPMADFKWRPNEWLGVAFKNTL